MSTTTSTSGATPRLPADAKTETLGIVFFDLSRFAEWTSAGDDERVAGLIQCFYELSAEHLEPAGARIVKFIGDAGMAVFQPDDSEGCILALSELARTVREWAGQQGFDTYLNINVHVGPVVSGTFGPPSLARYDVLGKAVNVAARLGRNGLVLSPQAFRTLSPAARKQFDKNMPPITYRFRW